MHERCINTSTEECERVKAIFSRLVWAAKPSVSRPKTYLWWCVCLIYWLSIKSEPDLPHRQSLKKTHTHTHTHKNVFSISSLNPLIYSHKDSHYLHLWAFILTALYQHIQHLTVSQRTSKIKTFHKKKSYVQNKNSARRMLWPLKKLPCSYNASVCCLTLERESRKHFCCLGS